MLLFVGLGNPGPKYAGHRHNVGFQLLDRLAEDFGPVNWSKKFSGEIAELTLGVTSSQPSDGAGTKKRSQETAPALSPRSGAPSEAQYAPIGGQLKILLLKPQTYMNRSGQSVRAAMQFYKLTPQDVTVFHDELDLPTGKLRIKRGGGHGGHNGLRDIDAQIGKDYRRVRIGIDHPGDKDLVSPYVLHDFSKQDVTKITPLLEELSRNASLLAQGNDAEVMNRCAVI